MCVALALLRLSDGAVNPCDAYDPEPPMYPIVGPEPPVSDEEPPAADDDDEEWTGISVH